MMQGNMQARGRLRVATVCAAACLTSLLTLSAPAFAQKRPLEGQQVVLYTFGGTQLETTRELVIKPFEEETGAKVIVDDSCCQRLQAAMEAGQFIGDVVVGLDRGGMLARDAQGMFIHDPRLEKIARDHGAPDPYPSPSMLILHSYSYVIGAKDSSVPLPKSWAEFWDVAKFPGTRGLIRIGPTVQLEAALLADGVPADKLYPLDADRAFKKLTELKKSSKIIINASGADMINNLGTGETTYAIVYSNRAFLAKRDGIKINFSYDDGFLVGNGGAILKGAKNVDGAVAFLEYHSRPEVLARFAERTGMAPAYPASAALIAPQYRSMMPTAPENIGRQHAVADAYWQKNFKALGEKWVEWMAQ
jgi:putative spermidine/putrescine transport system substrate-binding protein